MFFIGKIQPMYVLSFLCMNVQVLFYDKQGIFMSFLAKTEWDSFLLFLRNRTNRNTLGVHKLKLKTFHIECNKFTMHASSPRAVWFTSSAMS